MESIAYVMPILPGRSDECRLIASESMGKRRDEYAKANTRKGITREFNWIQKDPRGDMLITYLEADDVGEAYRKFLESTDEYDKWYKEQLHYVTGVDFSEPREDNTVTLLELQGEAVAHAIPVAMVLPVRPGRTEAVKAWFEELNGPRCDELRNYMDRANLARVGWYLQPAPEGDLLIGYMLVEDPAGALRGYAYSGHPFDTWMKQQLLEYTGIDFNAPEAGPFTEMSRPELILDWHHAYEAAA